GLTGIVAIDANGESIFSGVEQLSKARLNTLLGSPLVIEGGSEGVPTLKYAPPHASAGAPPPLRIVFMGSADVSCRVLRALHMTPGFVIQGVVTQPDRPSGRYRHLQPCEAKTAALALGLPVITPEKVNAQEVRSQIVDWRPDVIVVVAYGQFLGPKILSLPPLGCLNVHLSLLPRYRGAAPVHRCINAGDTVSGVTIMRMDPGMDSGDIVMQESEPIHADDTAGTLHERLSELGASLIVKCLPKWRAGLIIPHAQKPEFVTFANKLTKEEAKLDWAEESAADLARHVRAFNPWPACYTFFEYTRHGRTQTERLKILRARAEDFPEGAARTPAGTVADISPDGPAIATNGGMLRLLEVQRPGACAVSGADFLRGCPVRVMQNFDAPQPPPPKSRKKDKDKSKDKDKTSDAHDD
ncbi:MAG: methionyl-tRNA formyltransferase, partial [Kiritimatiellae bacterium]|nr:methionyl-tRNA formyltransferase [Kiritimatiellia bacterium]